MISNNGTTFNKVIPPDSLVPIEGRWHLDPAFARFEGVANESFKIGVALTGIQSRAGQFGADVTISETDDGCAHLVFGHDLKNLVAYTVGIGGFHRAYSVSEYHLPSGSKQLFGLGQKENLQANRQYRIEVQLQGQAIRFIQDGARVFDFTLPRPLYGDQFGVKGYGQGTVTFSHIGVTEVAPRAFVIMQFSEPYNSLWTQVIRPVATRAGYTALRADDVFRPGIVLQDILQGITESDVVIAEVTPQNANVFYELGYAHALQKPAILLAEHVTSGALPFDISGMRCIFYDDAIRGKAKVEDLLERHLRNIRDDREPSSSSPPQPADK